MFVADQVRNVAPNATAPARYDATIAPGLDEIETKRAEAAADTAMKRVNFATGETIAARCVGALGERKVPRQYLSKMRAHSAPEQNAKL